MSHEATESFAIVPHNLETSRVESLMPEQLRSGASNLITLLKEYYDYMNEDGIVRGCTILNSGGGGVLPFDDLTKADVILGMKVFDFIPSNYNQNYIKLTDEENETLNIGSSIAYRGITDSNYFILKMDKNRTSLYDTWVLAFNNSGDIRCDFYDSLWEQGDLGSVGEDPSGIGFRGNTGGSFTNLDTTAATAFVVGKIEPLALSKSSVNKGGATETTVVNFTDIEVKGGHGSGLTLDIVADEGKVVSAIPNKPGRGYRIDDYLELDILQASTIIISDIIASPSNVVRRVLEEHDIDKTTEDYLAQISKEIAKGVPNAKNLDRNSLYKKIVEYYNTRGSESSIESFFKIFFDEIATVSYPKEFLLKPSDGTYQGTSSEAETREKYYYKKGYDDMRRIHFLKNQRYNDIKLGTYFIDIEFSENFKSNVVNSELDGQALNAFKQTQLFSGSNSTGTNYSKEMLKDAGVSLLINSSGDLIISGRFGVDECGFSKTFSSYVSTAGGDFPFQDAANKAKKRLRLAISVDISQSQTNAFGNKGTAKINMAGGADGTNSIVIDTTTGTIENGQVVVLSGELGGTNTVTNVAGSTITLSQELNNVADDAELEFRHPLYVIGVTKIAATNTSAATVSESASLTNSTQTGTGTQKTNLYPGALGSVFHSGSINSFDPKITRELPEADTNELYFYGFGFVPRICTDTEKANYLNNKVFPNDKIVDINLDNNGSANITNKSRNIIIAKAIKGGGFYSDPLTTETGSMPILETNYGLSSTGSAYPRVIKFKDFKGFLSDRMKLHDGNYYQEFSYLIRTKLSVDNWETEFQKLVHPAGMKFFTALFLELASTRTEYEKPIFDPADFPQWLRNLNNLTIGGSHSPKWQPGWFEYFTNVYIEIVLYELYSAFHMQKQTNFNKQGANFYNYNKGLKIGKESSNVDIIKGNAKKAIIESSSLFNVNGKYIELDGDGTAIKTDGKLTTDSELELTFRLKKGVGGSTRPDFDNNKGKFLAGTRYRGLDGSWREFSIKGMGGNKIGVITSDHDSQYRASSEFGTYWEAIEVTGTNYSNNTNSQGVKFSDPRVTQEIHGSEPSGYDVAQDNTFVSSLRGHNLLCFNPQTKTYRFYHFDTYDGTVSGHSDFAEAEHALHDQIRDESEGIIIILFTFDAAGCHTNVYTGTDDSSAGVTSLTKSNGPGPKTSTKHPIHHADWTSATGFAADTTNQSAGLRWALGKYCGAPDRFSHFGRVVNSTTGAYADYFPSTSSVSHRTSHVFIGRRNDATEATDIEVAMISSRTIEKISGQTISSTGRHDPVTVSMQYMSGVQSATTGITNRSVTWTGAADQMRLGPYVRDKLLGGSGTYQTDAEVLDTAGLNYAKPFVIDLGANNVFKTLNIRADGEIKLDGTILRSKYEASSPKVVKELLLENYDFSDLFETHFDGTTDADSDFSIHHPSLNSSGSFYYDDELKGVVSTGGNRWMRLLNKTKIDNEDVRFNVEFEVQNISETQIGVYFGHQTLNSSGSNHATDKYGTYNYYLTSTGSTRHDLAANAVKTITTTIGGFNPPNSLSGGYRDQTAAGAVTTKFDPGGVFFNLVMISNYSNTAETSKGGYQIHRNLTTPRPLTPALLIKKIKISRQDGKPVEFDCIRKYSPDFSVDKITSTSLGNNPVKEIESKVTLGSLNLSGEIAGLETMDTAFSMAGSGDAKDTNLVSTYLPWPGRPHNGECTVNGGTWKKVGLNTENERRNFKNPGGQLQPEYFQNPFGEAKFTWRAVNRDTSLHGDGGLHTPYITIDPNKDHRATFIFKRFTTASTGKFFLGFTHSPSLAQSSTVGGSAGSIPFNGYGSTERGREEYTPMIRLFDEYRFNSGTESKVQKVEVGTSTVVHTTTRMHNTSVSDEVIPVIFRQFAHTDFPTDTGYTYPANRLNHGTNLQHFFLKFIDEVDGLFRYQVYSNALRTTNHITSNGTPTTITLSNLRQIHRIGNQNVYALGVDMNNEVLDSRWVVAHFHIKGRANNINNGNRRIYKKPEWVGLWDLETGEKLNNVPGLLPTWQLSDNSTLFSLRMFQNSVTSTRSAVTLFAEPAIEVLDGTEKPYDYYFSLPKHRISQYPSAIDISKAVLNNSTKENTFRFDFTGIENAYSKTSTINGKYAQEVQPITSVPSTETGVRRADVTNLGFAYTPPNIGTLVNKVKGQSVGYPLKATGIKNVDRDGSTYKTSADGSLANGTTFTIKPGDYTTSGSGTGASFFIDFSSGMYETRVEVLDSGTNFVEGEIVTIPKANIGNAGPTDFTFKVQSLGNGKISYPNSKIESTNDGRLRLGLDSTIATDSTEISNVLADNTYNHNLLFNKEKEYEVSFDCERIYDYNLPANLYISGGNKIGKFYDLTGMDQPSLAVGNPHVQGQTNHGNGPREFTFNSTEEGFCRIFFACKEVENGYFLAHNGHELRVKSTQYNKMHIDRVPTHWWVSNNELGNQNQVVRILDDQHPIDQRARYSTDADAFATHEDGNPAPATNDFPVFVFESEWLTYGENTIQLYSTAGDGVEPMFLQVAPANQGLITEGSNKHTIYMDNNISNPKIVIDHKIDRDTSRTLQNTSYGRGQSIANFDKLYAYSYKLSNIKVTEKRKLFYKGEFKPIVGDPADTTIRKTNSDPLFGTPDFRQINISSTSAVDGVLVQGGQVIIPAIEKYDSDANVGQTFISKGSSKNISSITLTNPVRIVTTADHGFTNSKLIFFEDIVGTTELNDNVYYIKYINDTTFDLYTDFRLTNAVVGTAMTAYTSGGKAKPSPFPQLGIPKGNYGILKMISTNQAVHYLDIGTDRTRFPYNKEQNILTWTPNEDYEITGEVFIPTSNSKLQEVCVMAGVNPRKVNETTNQPESDASGKPLFKLLNGKHQVMSGPLAGYDYLSAYKTNIITKGSWVSFKHKFKTRGVEEDPTPVIRIVSTVQGNNIPLRLENVSRTYSTPTRTPSSNITAKVNDASDASNATIVIDGHTGTHDASNNTKTGTAGTTANPHGIAFGMFVTGTGVPANAFVSTIDAVGSDGKPTQITLQNTTGDIANFSLADDTVLTFEPGLDSTFNVVNNKGNYEVSVATAGTRNIANATYTVAGDQVGGNNTENNLTITVRPTYISAFGNADSLAKFSVNTSAAHNDTNIIGLETHAGTTIVAGMFVSGVGIPTGTIVKEVTSQTSIKLGTPDSSALHDTTAATDLNVDTLSGSALTFSDFSVAGQGSVDIEAYTGDAENEYFYVKNIRIKEGADPDKVEEKEVVDNRREAFINKIDNRDYTLIADTPTAGNGLISTKITHPSDSSFTVDKYDLKINDTTLFRTQYTDEFTIQGLQSNESNELSTSLPFPVNATTNTASYGRSDINHHSSAVGGTESNTPADLINSPNGYTPIGNPIQIGNGTTNSPYTTTYENVGKFDLTPFTRDVVWEARNTDGAWRALTKINKNANGTGYVGASGGKVYNNVPLIDIGSKGVGVNATANITVNSAGAVGVVTLTSGGFNYGKNQSNLYGIPLSLAIGPKYVSSNSPAAPRSINLGDSPEKCTALTDGTSNPIVFTGKVDTGSGTATANYNIHNSPATTGGTIEPGMVVTGTGISGTVTVSSVNYQGTGLSTESSATSIPIVLSSAQTLSNLTQLTFTKQEVAVCVNGKSTVGGGTASIKAGMLVTGSNVIAGTTVKSVSQDSPSQSRLILDKPNTTPIANDTTLTFEDPFYGLARGTGLEIKGNIINDPAGSDSPAMTNTNFSYNDGGFKSPSVAIDHTKKYRVSVWVKQSDTTFTSDSPHANNTTLDMGGRKIIRWKGASDSAITTPLEINNGNNAQTVGTFINDFDLGKHSATSIATSTGLNNNKWLLVVGHIHPSDTVLEGFTNDAQTGVYLPSKDATKYREITNVKHGDWIFSSAMKHMVIEALVHSNPRSSEDPVQFFAPRIDLIDGNEPTLLELTSGKVLYNTPGNLLIKEIPITSWNESLSDTSNKTISNYKHFTDEDTFTADISQIYNLDTSIVTNYADKLDKTLAPSAGTRESIFQVNFSTANGFSAAANIPIILPLKNSGSAMNAFVDWGDGSSNIIRYTSDKDLYHTYTGGGGNSYKITVSGTYHKIQSTGQTSTFSASSLTDFATLKTAAQTNWKNSLESVILGNTTFVSSGLTQAFDGCVNLLRFTSQAGVTNTTAVTRLDKMLNSCKKLDVIDMSGMDTQNVTRMDSFHNITSASDAKTVTMIEFHSRNINKLRSGNGNGLKDAFKNVTINTEELNRCYLTWATNKDLPTGRVNAISGGGDATGTALTNHKVTCKSNGSHSGGATTIAVQTFVGPGGTSAATDNIEIGDVVTSNNLGIPRPLCTVTNVIAGSITITPGLASGITNNVLLTIHKKKVTFQSLPTVNVSGQTVTGGLGLSDITASALVNSSTGLSDATVIPIDNVNATATALINQSTSLTGTTFAINNRSNASSIMVGATVTSSTGGVTIPADTTVTSVTATQITLSASSTMVDNAKLEFSKAHATYDSTNNRIGNIRVGSVIGGTGIPTGLKVTEVIDANSVRVNYPVTFADNKALTFSKGFQVASHAGNVITLDAGAFVNNSQALTVGFRSDEKFNADLGGSKYNSVTTKSNAVTSTTDQSNDPAKARGELATDFEVEITETLAGDKSLFNGVDNTSKNGKGWTLTDGGSV